MLKLKPHDLDVNAEKEDVPTWTLAELKTIWALATPLERTVLVLAFNAAMGADQLGRLKTRHISFDKNLFSRTRRKKMVRVTHHLFAMSKKALEWYLARRPKPNEETDTVLITKNGLLYYRQTKNGNRSQDIPNLWKHLLDRQATSRRDREDSSNGSRRLQEGQDS